MMQSVPAAKTLLNLRVQTCDMNPIDIKQGPSAGSLLLLMMICPSQNSKVVSKVVTKTVEEPVRYLVPPIINI